METNFTLDEMILQYSENPFVSQKQLLIANNDKVEKQRILGKLLMLANDLFKKDMKVLSSYKHRYEYFQFK